MNDAALHTDPPPTEARAAIALILTRLRTPGFIAT
jgi:hypothetical protein